MYSNEFIRKLKENTTLIALVVFGILVIGFIGTMLSTSQREHERRTLINQALTFSDAKTVKECIDNTYQYLQDDPVKAETFKTTFDTDIGYIEGGYHVKVIYLTNFYKDQDRMFITCDSDGIESDIIKLSNCDLIKSNKNISAKDITSLNPDIIICENSDVQNEAENYIEGTARKNRNIIVLKNKCYGVQSILAVYELRSIAYPLSKYINDYNRMKNIYEECIFNNK